MEIHMNAVLTSSLGGAFKADGKRVPSVLIEKNGLLDKIRSLWPEKARVLMICASPSNYEKNDAVLECFRQSLPMSGLNYSCLDMCDDRSEETATQINSRNVIILTGGHVPTQNAFFKKIRLKENLKDYQGLVLAWSAGSMNCADLVYAGPELPGEAIDPSYERWISGLGLTKVNMLPHFQILHEEILDGLRVVEDITFPDSMKHEIIAMNDGSYIVIDDNGETLYGEAYSIKDGILKPICYDGTFIRL
jgi:dipeptidase E